MPKNKLGSNKSKPTANRTKKKVVLGKKHFNIQPILLVILACLLLAGIGYYGWNTYRIGNESDKVGSALLSQTENKRQGDFKNATSAQCKKMAYEIRLEDGTILCSDGYEDSGNRVPPENEDVIKSATVYSAQEKEQLLKLKELEESSRGSSLRINEKGVLEAVPTQESGCLGDSRLYKISILYLGAASSNRVKQVRDYARMIDFNVLVAANKTGHRMRANLLRSSDCVVQVRSINVSNPAIYNTYAAVVNKVNREGYHSNYRKYVIFTGTERPGTCGSANRSSDTNRTQDNANNYGPDYAVVWMQCWANGGTATHELFHTLGAVQENAPHYDNSDDGGHTNQTKDIMYKDSSRGPATSCSDVTIDCGSDDYFHPNPTGANGTYLRRNWNTADSRFLIKQ